MERFRKDGIHDQIYSIYEAAWLDATRKKEWIDTTRSWSEIRIKIERIRRLRRILATSWRSIVDAWIPIDNASLRWWRCMRYARPRINNASSGSRRGRQATNIHETSMPTMTSCPLLNRLLVIDTMDLYVICMYVCARACVRVSVASAFCLSCMELKWRGEERGSPFVNTRSRVRLVERSLSFELCIWIVCRNGSDDTYSFWIGGVSGVIFFL